MMTDPKLPRLLGVVVTLSRNDCEPFQRFDKVRRALEPLGMEHPEVELTVRVILGRLPW